MTAARRPRYDALFLDRDGTLIAERGFPRDPSAVRLAPGAAALLRRFAETGTRLFVVTNQSGIARGLLTWAEVEAVNAEMVRRYAARGVPLAEVLVCPHHPDGTVAAYRGRCRCRKPATGLHEKALRRYGLRGARTAVIGDKWDDVAAAARLGAVPVHLLSGWGRKHRSRVAAEVPDAILAGSLADGLRKLLAPARRPRRPSRRR